MKTDNIPVWKLDENRYINVEYDDWEDYVIEDFKMRMQDIGIEAHQVYWSGFCSQGDGACFEGRIDDVDKYLAQHCRVDEYPMIRKLIKHKGYFNFNVRHDGRYYHANCTNFDIDYEHFQSVLEQPTEFHERIAQEYDNKLVIEVEDFFEVARKQFKDYMVELYRTLDAEYEQLTSDEAVARTLIDNDLIEEN